MLPAAQRQVLRLGTVAAPLLLSACGALIGLSDLEKADVCEGACAGVASGGSIASGGSAGGVTAGASSAGATLLPPMPSGGRNGAGGSAGAGTSAGMGGVAMGGGGASSGGAGSASGGTAGTVEMGPATCPGGPMPPTKWTEHWYEHNQVLTRVYYDDCIALYFDADVPADTKTWLSSFLSKGWSYSLATYGRLGNERMYAVAHLGRYFGGHSATFDEASHDYHDVIDMGTASWADSTDLDLPAHLMAFLVDALGAHTKFGAPKSEHYGNEGFPLIYKYDLYVGLGLNANAKQALADFNMASNDQPYPGTFWFRDWFYPLWRDHGHAKIFANYMTLLEQYYPTDADGWMPTMNYGQYFHFMSGAAGVDLVPTARDAFQWHPDFDDEIAAAKKDFPQITY